MRRILRVRELFRVRRIRRIPQDSDSSELGYSFLEQFEALAGESSRRSHQSRDVACWSSQTRYESEPDWVVHANKDDRHRRGRFLYRKSRWCSRSHDDVDLRAQKLLGEPRELIEATIGKLEFDEHILIFDVSAFTETLPKPLDPGLRWLPCTEKPDPVHFCRLRPLRVSDGAGEEDKGRRDEQQKREDEQLESYLTGPWPNPSPGTVVNEAHVQCRGAANAQYLELYYRTALRPRRLDARVSAALQHAPLRGHGRPPTFPSAPAGTRCRSLDHFIRPQQQRLWNRQAERFCGLEVDG